MWISFWKNQYLGACPASSCGNKQQAIEFKRVEKRADKPGSVVGNHSSRPVIADRLQPPTRRLGEQRHSLPIWCCSGWRLPRFTSATAGLPARGLLVSVALFLASRRLAVSQHPALWSPDFPLPAVAGRQRLPGPLFHVRLSQIRHRSARGRRPGNTPRIRPLDARPEGATQQISGRHGGANGQGERNEKTSLFHGAGRGERPAHPR